MKKSWLLLVALLLGALTLAWCNCNCKNGESEVDARLQQAMDYCLEHWGTHSLIHSQTAVYGECMFPSGIGCEDDMVLNGECDYTPNTENIDTEEERLAGCEESVQWWMRDMVEWAENVTVKWGDESEGGASLVRNWVITYRKDRIWYAISVECVADFVDGSISVTYGDEVAEDEFREESVDNLSQKEWDKITIEEVTE